MPGSTFPLEVQPRIPAELGRLPEIANDLMYSWDRSIRSLFHRLDRELWDSCGHTPKVFLRQVSQENRELSAAGSARNARDRPVGVIIATICSNSR